MAPLKKATCKIVAVVLETPIGHVKVDGCKVGVHRITMTPTNSLPLPEQSAKTTKVLVEPEYWTPPLRECCDWLDTYFKNPNAVVGLSKPRLHTPEFKSDTFTSEVWQRLESDVSVGQTVSYKELASMVGNPKAARAVGGAMRLNPIPLVIPCHRVLGSDGKLVGFMSNKGLVVKDWLLKHEGASF